MIHILRLRDSKNSNRKIITVKIRICQQIFKVVLCVCEGAKKKKNLLYDKEYAIVRGKKIKYKHKFTCFPISFFNLNIYSKINEQMRAKFTQYNQQIKLYINKPI